MPDRFDEMVHALRGDTGRLIWDDPASVRQRAARRGRRQFAVAALATMLMISGGAATGWAVASHNSAPPAVPPSPTAESPSPGDDPTGSPTRTEPTVEIPDDALLQPEDAGPGHRVESPQGIEDGQLGYLLGPVCGASDWTDTYDQQIGDGRHRFLNGERWVSQIAHRYQPRVGRTFMGDLRKAIDRCATMESQGRTYTLTVVDSGFAGEDSILVKVEVDQEDAQIPYHAFVRQGDLVTEVWFEKGTAEAEARRIAGKAAQRLCAATPAC